MRRSIEGRVTQFAWLVTLLTVLTFVLFIIPVQKRSLMNELTARARAIQEKVYATASLTPAKDLGGLNTLFRTLLTGDGGIRLVVITQADGASFVYTSGGIERMILGPRWQPPRGRPVAEITRSELTREDLFLYSHAYPQVGGNRGWIHVGLSLDSYRAGLRDLYNRTALVAILCAVISMLVSAFFVRRLVRPLRHFMTVVQRVSDGDLSARAAIRSRDEIETMAMAFNAMTERLRQTHADLTAARDFTENVIRSMNDALIVLSPERRILSVNDATCRLLGYTEKELVGQPVGILSEIVLSGARHTAALVEQRVPLRNAERRLRAKDGRLIPVLFSSTPLQGQAGRVQGYVCVALDITDIQRAREAAEEASLAKSAFLANMSHEIRTPVNGIVGMLKILRDTNLERSQQRYVDMALRSADTMLSLINDILDFSKIEAGKLELESIVFNLRDVVENTVQMFTGPAARKGLELAALVYRDVPPRLVGDPQRIGQILINLVGNAVKFTEAGEVVVRVRKLETVEHRVTLAIEVSDTGIGIPEDKIQRLFDSFSQADTSTTRRFGGSGLGLAISNNLARLMDGKITVSSRPGEGSVFTLQVTLPRAAGQPIEGLASPRGLPLRNLKLLVVDDSPTNREVVREMAAAWGCTIDEAESGSEALAKLRETRSRGAPYAAVLVDGSMPGMNGDELGRRIKGDTALRDTPLIMLTSLSSPDIRAIEAIGFVAVLNKPVTASQVYEALNEAVGRGARHAPRAAAPPPPKPGASHRGARLLIAEDNDVNREVVRTILEREGFVCECVENGAEAVEAATGGDYALILMDCQMPVMDGYKATETLRALGCRLPIVALTADALTGTRERCLEAGMNAYMTKPLDPAGLTACVTEWLNRAPKPGEPAADPAPVADGGHPAGNGDPNAGDTADPDVFDYDDFLARCVGRPDVALRVYQTFAQSAPKDIAALEQAAGAGDAKPLEQLGHRLTGSAATRSARALSRAAARVETLGREQLTGEAPQAVAAVRRAFDRLIAVAEKRFSSIAESLRLPGQESSS